MPGSGTPISPDDFGVVDVRAGICFYLQPLVLIYGPSVYIEIPSEFTDRRGRCQQKSESADAES
jgi:hypothetical protein